MKKHLLRDIIFITLLVALVTTFFFSPFGKSLLQPDSGPNKAAIPIPTPTPLPPLAASLSVAGTQWGLSTCSIGTVEGDSGFNISDLKDLGITNYHIYGSMSRWEAQDDSKVYGQPTIAQIKADPNVINWPAWDTAMTNPPGGSDYWWTNDSPIWKGNARTIFSSLQTAHIQPIVDLRPVDDHGKPSWMANPPQTTADWNEWWEHVFALVYWLNVRNNYNVNDFEIGNEPNLPRQGWHGTESQYLMLGQYAHDAINYVYQTYLPGHTYHIYGPATSGDSPWPQTVLQQGVPSIFNDISIHDYDSNISQYVEQVHGWMNATGNAKTPLWLVEWGSYDQTDKYDLPFVGINLLNNLISGSRPGNDYLYGSSIFALYDFGNMPGLIRAGGIRTLDYYALRLGIRALQGCRPTYQSITSTQDLIAITTRNSDGSYALLVTNQSQQQPYMLDVDLSALLTNGSGAIQRFDDQHLDTNAGTAQLTNGHTALTIPPQGAILLTVSKK